MFVRSLCGSVLTAVLFAGINFVSHDSFGYGNLVSEFINACHRSLVNDFVVAGDVVAFCENTDSLGVSCGSLFS